MARARRHQDLTGPRSGSHAVGWLAATAAAAVVVGLIVVAVVVLALGDQDSDRTAGRPDRSDTARAASSSPAGPELFGPAPASASSQPPDISLGTPRRARYVSFDDAALPATADGTALTLDFFDDAVFTARIQRLDRQQMLTSWSGPLDGMAHSDVVITLAGGQYRVIASTTRGTFTMALTRSGLYQVEEVERSLPADSGAAEPSVSASATG